MSADPKQVKSIFLAAADMPVHERTPYLDQVCGIDLELRNRIELLLSAHDQGSEGLMQPVAGTVEAKADEQSLAEDSGSPQIGTAIGPYKLLQEIGEGGMGIVFMAQQQEPVRRMVALKVIKPGMDSREVLARFEAERQAIALMDHPNIAKVFDAGTTDAGRPYFVMELVKGKSITKHCDEHQLSPRERLELFVSVCQAVQHAHQKGVIHRDIKPSNILVAQYDGRPVPKVIDFGVAKAMGQQLTEKSLFTAFGGVVGTLEYMSPEQAELNALDIDTRSDVYSLGVVLYELLTGTTPLNRKQLKQAAMNEALRLIREEEPPKPSTRLSTSDALPSLSAQRKMEPAKLTKMMRGEPDWMVMKALEKDRSRRYETANALARDIERYLHDEPVEAGPPSAGYRLRKLAWRYRTAARMAVAFLLLLVAGVIGSTWQAVRATRAEESATEERNRALGAETEAKLERNRAKDAETEAKFAMAATEKAKAETERALKQSELARDQAKAVSKFLVEAFRSPDPSKSGRDIKVAEILDHAAAELDGKFMGSITIKGDLLSALGHTYSGLGLTPKALEMHEKALALRNATLGADHLDTIESMNNLAVEYLQKGLLDEAIKLFTETVEFFKAKVGPDEPRTLGALSNLASAYQAAGKHAKAIPLLEESTKLLTAKLGRDHTSTLSTMNNLGAAYRYTGRWTEAKNLLEETVELMTAKLGPDHPDTLLGMNNLAAVYRFTGRWAEAIALFDKTLTLEKAKFGLDHPNTLICMNDLAGAYWAAGRVTEAIPLFEETYKLMTAKLGADHPYTLNTMSNLAENYRAAGRLTEAISLHEEALKLLKAKLGSDHPKTLTCLSNLALAYFDAGRMTESVAMNEETLKLRRSKLGAEHPDTLTSMNNLALAYFSADRLPEAIPLLEEALKLFIAKLGAAHPETMNTRNNLAGAYEANGKLALAESMLVEQLELVTKKRGAKDAQTGAALAMLGSNLLKQMKYTDAEPRLRESLSIRQQNDPNIWTTFNTQSLLGGALLGQRKYAEAELLLLQGFEGMKQRADKIPQPARTRLIEAVERLVQLYEETEQPEKTTQYRGELEALKKKQQESKK